LVYPAKVNSSVVKTSFTNHNADDYASQGLVVTPISMDDKRQGMMVTNFKDEKQAMQYYTELSKDPKFYTDMALTFHQEFIISDTNFNLLITSKYNVAAYVSFFKENYQP